ncbi:alginate export family protein [Parvularcula oceani]|uniref:alginate export family protein n=1 Tax=Parvularcula oceani TaxID=1247963 RepID=UPI000B01113D|nr:alginate export family protein [Parvularcula oceani]
MAAQDGSGLSLHLAGEARVRYESLDGQFRAGRTGSDQALFTRALLLAELRRSGWAAGVELQDSEAFLDDAGTPLSSSYVNPIDVLQAYVRWQGATGNWTTSATFGRQTVSIGSKRQIERVSYANVVKNYSGVHVVAESPRGDLVHVVGLVPVGRFPSNRQEIGDNVPSADEEQWQRRIGGVHYRRANALPVLADDVWLEGFVYALHEDDAADVQTPNRRYVQPGGRLYRAPAAGRWDADVEGAARFGSRRTSSDAENTRDLDVFATMLFAAVGYSWDVLWQPRLAAEWYWASGDDDPADDEFGQYERLFGGRRTDLGNTSLHGPLTPANLNAPGARLEVKPTTATDARIAYSAAFLASETDEWVIADLRDPAGRSGSFIGHALDGRARWRPHEGVEIEMGASALFFGEFADRVPGAPEGQRTLFGYAQVSWVF